MAMEWAVWEEVWASREKSAHAVTHTYPDNKSRKGGATPDKGVVLPFPVVYVEEDSVFISSMYSRASWLASGRVGASA